MQNEILLQNELQKAKRIIEQQNDLISVQRKLIDHQKESLENARIQNAISGKQIGDKPYTIFKPENHNPFMRVIR